MNLQVNKSLKLVYAVIINYVFILIVDHPLSPI